MNGRRSRGPLALVACALVVGACEGPNLFTGPGTSGGEDEAPVVLTLDVPEFVRPNDVLDVGVEASSVQGITQLDVTVVEGVVQQRTLTFDPPRLNLSASTSFQMPSPLTRTSITVRVEVQDRLGARSEPKEVQIPVVQDRATT